jgi:hypothetical protein
MLINTYVIVVKGYILNIKFMLHQNHILKISIFDDIKNEKTIKHVLICKYCKNNFDLLLQNHIITNKLNMILLMLNKFFLNV